MLLLWFLLLSALLLSRAQWCSTAPVCCDARGFPPLTPPPLPLAGMSGWVLWLMQEALKRNPAIKIGGLAWTWPGWTKGSVPKKVCTYRLLLLLLWWCPHVVLCPSPSTSPSPPFPSPGFPLQVEYLTSWVQGIKKQFNVTVDFMGLQVANSLKDHPCCEFLK